MNVVPYTASAAAPPYAAMMPAAWLSTISPAEAARKKTIESRQKTARRRSAAASVTLPVSEETATPAWATSHALAKPVMARTAAKPPRVARTPKRADRPAEDRRRDHRAGGQQAHDVAVDQALTARHRQVHDLLHEEVGRAAAEPEEHPVADRELGETARGRGQRQSERVRDRAGRHEERGPGDAVETRRHHHADAERGGGQGEDEGQVRAGQPEQRLQRVQEHAERVERADRRVERGGGREHAPRAARPSAAVHGRLGDVSSPERAAGSSGAARAGCRAWPGTRRRPPPCAFSSSPASANEVITMIGMAAVTGSAAELAGGLEPGQLRELDVHDDQVGHRLARGRHAGLPVDRLDQAVGGADRAGAGRSCG